MRCAVVDRKELTNFRRRALRRDKREYIEAFWGYLDGGILYVCVFQPFPHKGDTEGIYIDDEHVPEYGSHHRHLTLLGSIHTHPYVEGGCAPSECDWTSFEPGERFMGILTINKEGKRRKTKLLFFESKEPIEVLPTPH